MPWAVGRYNGTSYSNVAGNELSADMSWCEANKVDYVPLVFPGFSWGNLKNDASVYNTKKEKEKQLNRCHCSQLH